GDRYRRSAGSDDDPRHHSHVGRVRRYGEAGVAPPVAPCDDGNEDRQDFVAMQETEGPASLLGSLASIEQESDEEAGDEHYPAKRDDPAALIAEQVSRHGQLRHRSPLGPWRLSYRRSGRAKVL